MRSQKGITLITLVVTIVVLIILAGITIYSSIDNYKRMRYENYIAQLEELQLAVEKVSEQYKVGEYVSYSDTTNGFFIKKFDNIPGTLAISENEIKAETIINKYFSGNSSYHEGFVFYFSKEEIEDFFNINGIEFDIIVDFSTRYVYSVEGCKKPSGNEEIIYTLLDVKSISILDEDETISESSASGITFTQKSLQSGDTKMVEITLVLNYGNKGKKYDIKKAYYSRVNVADGEEDDDATKWLEVDYLGDCVYTKDTVKFYIYESGKYMFKIEDTSGHETHNIQGATDAVYTTINF